MGEMESFGKVLLLDFFVSKRVGTLWNALPLSSQLTYLFFYIALNTPLLISQALKKFLRFQFPSVP